MQGKVYGSGIVTEDGDVLFSQVESIKISVGVGKCMTAVPSMGFASC